MLTQKISFFQGLFNISDKLMVSFDILLEIRELFKTGNPLNNIISAKMNVLKMKGNSVRIDNDYPLWFNVKPRNTTAYLLIIGS